MDELVNYDTILSEHINRFRSCQKPIEVDFRSLVQLVNLDRQTHFLHPYPAKLLQHIPVLFLNNSILSSNNDTVCDPFLGSGTVALETLISNRNPIGFDINPFAVLLSKVKCTPIGSLELLSELERVSCEYDSTMPIKRSVLNHTYWYSSRVYIQLSKLLCGIERVQNRDVNDFFKICFSICARRLSFEDPRISVPVKLNPERYPQGHRLRIAAEKKLRESKRCDALAVFKSVVIRNIERLESLSFTSNLEKPKFFLRDSKNAPLEDEIGKAQLIITSPPYPGAQKYIRASGLSLTWLDLCKCEEFNELKKTVVGREEVKQSSYRGDFFYDDAKSLINEICNINKTRAAILETYLFEMSESLASMHKLLKCGGWMVVVAANSIISGVEVPTQEFLTRMAKDLGFAVRLRLVDTIKSRGLMTKRNKTANIIAREWVNVFEKV